MTSTEANAPIRCRNCNRPVPFAAAYCPQCGEADPSGRKAALVGSLIYGLVIAGILTCLYGLALSSGWERLQEKFSNLPPEHLLFDSLRECAVGSGIGLFLFLWVMTVAILNRFLRPTAVRPAQDPR
jgi:hypothetical protein